MELRDAFEQITTIRAQLARTERLRSLRAVPVALSALLAVLAAIAQSLWIPDHGIHPARYLTLWIGTAGIAALAAVLEMVHRVRSAASATAAETARQALLQFAPSCAVGALLTAWVVIRFPGFLFLLPPLWLLLFGLGNLAAARMLPRGAGLVGVFYLLAGGASLWMGVGATLQPWVMGAPFALGQGALAALLWWHQERDGAEAAA